MKIIFSLFAFCSVCSVFATEPDFPETFSPATFEEVDLPSNSVYRPSTFVAGDNFWFSGAVQCCTNVQDWGSYGMGYTSTQLVNYLPDAVVSDYSDSYLPSASGAAQGNNYASVNIMSLFEQIHFTKTTLTGMAVTNTRSCVDAILNGDGMSTEAEGTGKPFHQDDYFLLTIKGLNGYAVTGTIEFYLADFRTEGNWQYAYNWQWIDLESLGVIDGLQFELSSSKRNNWGMTTPAYFCMDHIGGNASDCTLGAMTQVGTTAIQQLEQLASPCSKLIQNGRIYIYRNGIRYNIVGHLDK